MNFFEDVANPTINELVNWFQVRYPKLANDMKTSNHNAAPDEPNPYHLEDQVWAHTMMVCLRAEENESNKIVSICALLHDIGKPESRGSIPFESKKPSHTESNDIRDAGKYNGNPSGLQREVPKSGLKTHFRGHEGLSFYKSVEVVNELENEGVLNQYEKGEILTIISLHGTLFDSIDEKGEMRKPHKVFKKFRSPEAYANLVSQVKNDSTGRFFKSKDGRKNNATKLGETIFTEMQYQKYKQENPDCKDIKDSDPKITVLVGPPCVGKSTWRFSNVEDEVIISRDDALMQYGKDEGILNKKHIECPHCDDNGMIETTFDYLTCDYCGGNNLRLVDDYSSLWKFLETHNLQKEVDNMVQKIYSDAVSQRKDIVVDMTNMSKKSRNKWIANIPRVYIKKAVVFAAPYDVIYKRNKNRSKEEGKNIPDFVIGNMMRGFGIPMYDEVDIIGWCFNG